MINYFGVRHFSPTGAHQLRMALDELNPTAILIEGPADATPFLPDLARPGTKTPIAILAYTTELPVETLVYPMASYSPEYQAILWGLQQGAHVEFIDLPSSISLARRREVHVPEPEKAETVPEESLYQRMAILAGEPDFEAYWERNFEYSLARGAYSQAISTFSRHLRDLSEETDPDAEHHLIREAYMKKQILRILEEGHSPEKVMVITGAYHLTGLEQARPMSDAELKALPKTETKLTLMPYSNYKLSHQSGYGAGNPAPAYFEMMWECLLDQEPGKLPAYYLSKLASFLREKGTYRSSAEVIEGVRLAHALASFRDMGRPTLQDLRDAAIVCLGQGGLSVIAEAAAYTEVGTAIGELPAGVSQTPIQDDFHRELKRLKLEKYRSNIAQSLDLDLRENRRAKTEQTAFLDLHRSFFLHRLRLLGVRFAMHLPVQQEMATWAERWSLQWTPEAEMELVESTLLGETIELAYAFRLKERLEACGQVGEAAKVLREAYHCSMLGAMEAARQTLQRLAADAGDFAQIAEAVHELAIVIRFGDIRRVDTAPLLPVLQQLFLRGTLLLVEAAGCNEAAAPAMISAISHMHRVALDQYDQVDEALWMERLQELAGRDDRNAKLSGYACALLLERSQVSNEQLAIEVSRRLSPGIPADLGAGWFEGLCMRNKYALLSRPVLWEQLDAYIASLDREAFQRALVFLRRSFATFESGDKVRIAELLGELWQVDADSASEYLNDALSQEEEEELDLLNDFDFGDI